MSYGAPNVSDAVASLVSREISRIIIMPMFLVTGNHIIGDIPELIANEQQRYPQLEFFTTQHFATHPALVDIIQSRINDTNNFKRFGQ